jgi:superfamily II DNA/RNA helicase
MSFDKTLDAATAAVSDSPVLPVAPVSPATPADLAAEAAPAPAGAFAALGLAPEIVFALDKAGYDAPTAVQARAVPAALQGQDLLVSSHTGSGKTAAFVLPALQRVLEARRDPARRRPKGAPSGPRVLVLAPTRELAQQVARASTVYGRGVQGLRVATVVGGVPYGVQLKALRGPLDLLIATPGRLLDLMGSGAAQLAQVELLVLDEADRMLDMGFIDDINAIAQALPEQRQTLMFSATFGGHVGALARHLTREPQRIEVDTHTQAHGQIEQRLYWTDNPAHKQAVLEHLLAERDLDQAVIFTSTQRDADDLAGRLYEMGHAVAALHGGMPQGRRNRVLQALRQRQLRVLVATDVAARGIDVPTITHVINQGLPMKAEDYVHRIGRTGRAGRTGLAITLALRQDLSMIRRIERFTTQPIASAVVPGMEPRYVPAPEPRRERPAGHGRPGPQGGYRRGPDGFAGRQGQGAGSGYAGADRRGAGPRPAPRGGAGTGHMAQERDAGDHGVQQQAGAGGYRAQPRSGGAGWRDAAGGAGAGSRAGGAGAGAGYRARDAAGPGQPRQRRDGAARPPRKSR